MADDNTLANVETLAGKVMDALADILRTSTSPDALAAQNLLLKRMALEGDVFPSRVPPPKNITEVGGYLNLLETLNEPEMRTQALAAILGVAGPNPIPGFVPTGPMLYDAMRANDRPAGAAQATIPVQFRVRNDFAPAFDAALKTIHDAGCMLPILSTAPVLPPATSGAAPPADLLPFLGRTLDLMPTSALADPDADALAVARLDGTVTLLVASRQLDATAPQAGTLVTQKWVAWKCDANACAESTADRKYLPLAPILNAAGWYQPALVAPAKLASPGNWSRWTNITGLVAGVSKFGDEISQRFARPEIAASVLREALDWVWDGQTFKVP
ncbi:MAG: hypothetical protein ACM3PU_08070 [Gemmatimonadota bacterium]